MCAFVFAFVNVRCGRLDDVNESMQSVSVGRDVVFVVDVVVLFSDIEYAYLSLSLCECAIWAT